MSQAVLALLSLCIALTTLPRFRKFLASCCRLILRPRLGLALISYWIQVSLTAGTTHYLHTTGTANTHYPITTPVPDTSITAKWAFHIPKSHRCSCKLSAATELSTTAWLIISPNNRMWWHPCKHTKMIPRRSPRYLLRRGTTASTNLQLKRRGPKPKPSTLTSLPRAKAKAKAPMVKAKPLAKASHSDSQVRSS